MITQAGVEQTLEGAARRIQVAWVAGDDLPRQELDREALALIRVVTGYVRMLIAELRNGSGGLTDSDGPANANGHPRTLPAVPRSLLAWPLVHFAPAPALRDLICRAIEQDLRRGNHLFAFDLLYRLWRHTGDPLPDLEPDLESAASEFVAQIRSQQGIGGLIASAVRPSGSAVALPYNIPINLFHTRVLAELHDLAGLPDGAPGRESLRGEILGGIGAYGLLGADGVPVPGEAHTTDARRSASGPPRAAERRTSPLFAAPVGAHFAYEVDGEGGAVFLDDAALPSLLSLPVLAGVVRDDLVYLATRARALSPANPLFAPGEGIGSESQPGPLAASVAIQGLTANNANEKRRCLRALLGSLPKQGWPWAQFSTREHPQPSDVRAPAAAALLCELAFVLSFPDT